MQLSMDDFRKFAVGHLGMNGQVLDDVCRQKYWNVHLNDVRRKSMNGLVCAECGKTFYAYGNRKYCCHECYITDRFGGAE